MHELSLEFLEQHSCIIYICNINLNLWIETIHQFLVLLQDDVPFDLHSRAQLSASQAEVLRQQGPLHNSLSFGHR